ncbi:MAG: LPS assembly protein LptD [Desulfovibrionaceae bacterium]|nr:LPS assembly protein LptD [Desulfovibrionaceae bacterium]
MANADKRRLALLPILLLCAALEGQARAENSLRLFRGNAQQQAWTLRADRVSSLAEGTVLEAEGRVELRLGEDLIQAEFARYFTRTNWVYLSGQVRLFLGEDRLEAREAEFDLRGQTGWLTDGRIFINQNHSYFQGEHITKHRGSIYSFHRLKYSVCDGPVPAWSFEANDGVLEMDGYARLRGVNFQVADLPVLYSPYLLIPAKTERQTGFLMPDYLNSSRNGLTLTLPFFLAVDSSRDLTVYESYMSRRGLMHGLVYRSKASEDEYLWLGFDYLHDREIILTDSNDRRYSGDGMIRANRERWWLRGMYEERLPDHPQWHLRADLDYVSDQYFLRDFHNNPTSFQRNNNALFSAFSRELKEEDKDRVSGLLLFRDWERLGMYLSGVYTQDPRLGNSDPALSWSPAPARSQDPTVQQLPALDFYLYQGRLWPGLPLELQAQGQGAYFHRRAGESGARMDLSPRLLLPFSSPYGSFYMAGRLRSTWYETEGRAKDADPGDKLRLLPDFEAQASTELTRVYQLSVEDSPGENAWLGMRHSILPSLAYRYTPYLDQSRYPSYTDYDRLDPMNEVVFSLDNLLTLKRATAKGRSAYQDLLRLRLEQGYDLREASRDEDLRDYPRRPWKDLLLELVLYSPGGLLSLHSANYYNPAERDFSRQTHGLTLKNSEQWQFSANLNRYKPVKDHNPLRRRDYSLSTASLHGSLRLGESWSASAYHDWPLEGTGQTQARKESGLNITYMHQCFQLGGDLIRSENETSFRLMFSLSGLGGLP